MYDIKVCQDTGLFIPTVTIINGDVTTEVTAEHPFHSRKPAIHWVVRTLQTINPEGPCRVTRKKVYNGRVIECPMFWEITSYNAKGEKLRTGQYHSVIQEGYLRGLIQDQFGFPLEAAEEIE